MAKKIKNKIPRNSLVRAMISRHPRSGKIKDRREERGGSKNKQSEYLEEQQQKNIEEPEGEPKP